MTCETIHFEFIPSSQRLDSFLAEQLPDISRAQIQDWIKRGLVTDLENGQALKASFKPKKTMTVSVDKPVLKPFEPPKPEHRPDALNIIFEDEHLMVINKPAGLTVHPGAGNHGGTLVNLLLGHTGGKLSDVGTQERPGIVHRLDKDTSGLMVVAKTNIVHVKLSEALQRREVKRIYQALVHNIPQPREDTIHTQIGRDPRSRQRMAVLPEGGKEAITHYSVLQAFGLVMALVECQLETGRTHQIRVHMASIGNPVVADPQYVGRHERGKKTFPDGVKEKIATLQGQLLHAQQLIFTHPVTGEEMHFTAELPDYFQEMLNLLSSYRTFC